MSANARNIGIFAHVDAGKTSLTERLLACCGAIRRPGSVDAGTAHTDSLPIERRRGISVRSACARMRWRDVEIRLVDTPGHADFAAEIERAVWALDGAVLLLSAPEGVQPQTELIAEALSEQGIPYIVFVNKCDRAMPDDALREARERIDRSIVPLTDADTLMSLLADADEAAMEAYVSGEIYARERLEAGVAELCRNGLAHPALCGSALKDIGIEPLLDAIVQYLPAPAVIDGPLSGIVFSVDDSDAVMGRAARVRLFSGALRNRDTVSVPVPETVPGVRRSPVERKVTQIREIDVDGRGADAGYMRSGDIALVYGLGDVRVGMALGDAALLPRKVYSGRMKESLMSVRVAPESPDRAADLDRAISRLCAQDPLLAAVKSSGGTQIRVTGRMQIDVVRDTFLSEWNLSVEFAPPAIIYRETIAEAAKGFYAYTMPKPCWAVIEFYIEPLPRGSGVQFESVVAARDIMPRYQHQVEQAIPLAVRQGMLGWRVDDVRITLTGGSHHLIHTHPLDFIVATPVAFLDGLRRAGSVLLEPMLAARITAPAELAGKILSRVVAMRGEITGTESAGESVRMNAVVPAATSLDFPTELSALTGGRGSLSMRLNGYRECEMRQGATAERIGVHPLDTARYILAARSALEGGIFDD